MPKDVRPQRRKSGTNTNANSSRSLRGAPQRQNTGAREGQRPPPNQNAGIERLEGKFDEFTGTMKNMFGEFFSNLGNLPQFRQQGNQGDQNRGGQSNIGNTTLSGEPDHRLKGNRPEGETMAGEPDMRYKENREEQEQTHTTVSGKPDERFAENRQPGEVKPDEAREGGPRRGNYSGERTDEEGKHFTKEGKPDHRFSENREPSEPTNNQQGSQGNQNQGRPASVRPPTNEREISEGNRSQGSQARQQAQGSQTSGKNEEEEDENNPGDEAIRRGDNLIELSTASYRDLRRIPMMGEGRAHMILDHRNRVEGFQSWDDVENIPGISKGMLAKLQEFCTVNGETIEDALAGDESEEEEEEENEPSSPANRPSSRPEEINPLVEKLLKDYSNKTNDPEVKEQINSALKRASSIPPANDSNRR
jgi:DNA uptake protein ComE-like DNA-binding protein